MNRITVGEHRMPAVGLGLWKVAPDTAADLVVDAVRRGYRHLDSACDYGNEHAVGEGIARVLDEDLAGRDDLWVTSKLWNTYHRPEHVAPALERTLNDLRVDYLDLYLIHFPIALKFVPFDVRYPPEWLHDPAAPEPRMEIDRVPISETWAAMEDQVEAGRIREIGVCNFTSALLTDLVAAADIAPSMLQIESHPYLTQQNLIRYAESLGVAVTAFSPLGAGSYVELDMARQGDSVLTVPSVVAIAERLGRTPAQVVLRWGVQRGTAVIPKTSRPERLSENIGLFDFELSDADMTAISALNADRRFNDPAVFTEQAFNTFHPIYD